MIAKIFIISCIINICLNLICQLYYFNYDKEKQFKKECNKRLEYFENVLGKDIVKYVFITIKTFSIISIITVLDLAIAYYKNNIVYNY